MKPPISRRLYTCVCWVGAVCLKLYIASLIAARWHVSIEILILAYLLAVQTWQEATAYFAKKERYDINKFHAALIKAGPMSAYGKFSKPGKLVGKDR